MREREGEGRKEDETGSGAEEERWEVRGGGGQKRRWGVSEGAGKEAVGSKGWEGRRKGEIGVRGEGG